MKVLLIIHGLRLGGAEMMVRQLAKGLVAQGQDVTVIALTSCATDLGSAIERSEARVIGLDKKPGFDLRTLIRLKGIVAEEGFDVVHSHLPILQYVVPAIIFSGRKVRHLHTFHSVAKHETRAWLRRLLNRVLLRLGRVRPIAITSHSATSLESSYGLKQVTIVPNGTELAGFQSAAANRVSSDKFRILHVGRFDKAKNHRVLLEIFASFLATTGADAVLTLLGDGDMRSEIEVLRDKLKLGSVVKFAGAQALTAPFYQNADVFVLPSSVEGFPITLIEAMAAELPVLCSNLPTLESLVTPGVEGYLENPEGQAFLNRLIEIWRDPSERLRMGKNAALRARKFGAQRMTDDYIRIYEGRA